MCVRVYTSSYWGQTVACLWEYVHVRTFAFTCDRVCVYALHTVWRVIFVGANFRGKSENVLKINFRCF